jgi:hypothetical protein
VPQLDLVRDVVVAPGERGAAPVLASAAAAARLGGIAASGGSRGIGELADNRLELYGVGARDAIRDVAIAENNKGWQRRDAVGLGDILLLVGIDLGEGQDARA